MSPFAQTAFAKLSKPKAVKAAIERHIKLLNIISSVLVAVFVFLYIAQANGAVSNGYKIRELENSIEHLTLENQRLEVENQKAQSLSNVSRATKMLGLVQADQPQYIEGDEPVYALAQ